MKNLNWQKCVLLCAMITQATFTFLVAVTRFNTFKSSLFDIGVFQQFYVLIESGLQPISAINTPQHPLHWLGFHFSPILYSLVPLHALFPFPLTLILIQSFLMSSAAWIIFCTARLKDFTDTHALFWALLFLANPYLINAAVGDFHEICFAVPLFAGVAYFLLAKRFYPMVGMLCLLVLTKEHYGVAMAATGIAWAIFHKDYKKGGILAVLGFVLFALIIGKIMPWFAGSAEHPMLGMGERNLGRYGWLHLPWSEKIRLYTYMMFPSDGNNAVGWSYLLLLFGTSGFLCLLSPWLLLPALADFTANMLSANIMTRGFYAYHSAAMVPVLIIATMIALKRYQVRENVFFFSMAVVLFLLAMQTTPLQYWQIDRFVVKDANLVPQDIQNKMPIGAPIAMQGNIGGHLPRHTNLYPFPAQIDGASYIVLRMDYPYADPDSLVFSMPYRPATSGEYLNAVKSLLNNPQWCALYWNNPILVLQRNSCKNGFNDLQRQEINTQLHSLEIIAKRLKKYNE
ncbi:MAG: DUF2079 domain-containing protein [Rickettsiales bacterium]